MRYERLGPKGEEISELSQVRGLEDEAVAPELRALPVAVAFADPLAPVL
jgi:hypothetical protein